MRKKHFLATVIIVLICTSAMAGGQKEASNKLNLFVAWELPEVFITEFEAETGIDVHMEVVTGLQDYKQARTAKIGSGESIDIITTFDDERAEFLRKGYFLDLKGDLYLDRLISGFGNAVARYAGDEIPGISFEIIMLNCWYNKDIFKRVGLEIPQNYQEFITVCDKLVEAGETPLVQGGKDVWPYEQELFLCFGNTPVDYPDWKKKLKNREMKWNEGYLLERFNRVQQLFGTNGYHIPNSAGISYDQAFILFAQQKAAMWLMGSWATEVMLGSEVKTDFEIGAFAPPCNDAGTTGAVQMGSDSRLYSILSNSKNVENAKKFFEFMTRKEIATRFADMNKTLSTIKGVEATSLPAYADFARILAEREGIPFMSFDTNVSQAKSDTIQALALSIKTAKEVTDAWQAGQEKDNSAGN